MRNNILDLRPALARSGFAPRGYHKTVFSDWVKMRDRSSYSYVMPSDELLRAMQSHADAEVMARTGRAREAAREWTGLNAILVERSLRDE